MAATPPRSIPRQMRVQLELIEPADDDLFANVAPSAPATEARITCRVCEMTASVPLDHPALLCPLCLENLDKVRDLVCKGVDAVLARMDVAKTTWNARSAGHEGWGKVAAAMVRVADKEIPQSVFDAQWAKRKAEGGELGALLVAYEDYARIVDQCAAELQRWHRAQAEVNAAWLATDV